MVLGIAITILGLYICFFSHLPSPTPIYGMYVMMVGAFVFLAALRWNDPDPYWDDAL